MQYSTSLLITYFLESSVYMLNINIINRVFKHMDNKVII